MLEVIYGKLSDTAIDNLVSDLKLMHLDGTLYIGYPILSTPEQPIFIEALLTCLQHGVIAFGFNYSGPDQQNDELFWQTIETYSNDLYAAIQSKLLTYRGLRSKKELGFPLNVITYASTQLNPPEKYDVIIASPETLEDVISTFDGIGPDYMQALNAAIQRVTNIKPPKKRASVKKEDSKGGIIKKIEAEIANLDRWQKRAAIETPEGPQRIRGLAGSGKTIVLALKAAYLHALHPEWTIAVTFQTRSLYQQFQDLIRRFSFEHTNDEPDWEKLRIIHAWGSHSATGMYYEIAIKHGLTPKDFSYGKNRFGAQEAFDGICQETLAAIPEGAYLPLYDVVMVDEAQDFPQSFFKLVYAVVPEPKRIIWAYDELQNLSEFSMSPPDELFGPDASGNPKVLLRNVDDQPRQDMILPVCYRNPPWSLAAAHALGFGIYRQEGQTQAFSDGSLWTEIGYEKLAGDFEPGASVTLSRSRAATPKYFEDYFKASDSFQFHTFDDTVKQAEWVASSISDNISVDELDHEDILVICLNPLQIQSDASVFIKALNNRGISGHIAGITSSRDFLFSESSIAVTSIYRAKGNEAPIVYILNSQYGFAGPELIKKRNALFTAITRSRAWVHVCGIGIEMVGLTKEIEHIIRNDYKLTFVNLDPTQLARIRRIHRDMTLDEKDKLKQTEQGLKKALEALESNDISVQNLPDDLLQKLKHYFIPESNTDDTSKY